MIKTQMARAKKFWFKALKTADSKADASRWWRSQPMRTVPAAMGIEDKKSSFITWNVEYGTGEFVSRNNIEENNCSWFLGPG